MSAWMGQARSRLPRVAEGVVSRARLTVVPRRQPAPPRTPFVALVAGVLLAGVVGLLLFNTSMQQASFRATALEAEAARLHAVEQSLQMQVDRLRDPQRVVERAQGLGMVPMTSPAFIQLADGTVLGEAVPASAQDQQRVTPLPTRKPAYLREAPVSDLPPRGPNTGADGVPTDAPGSARDTTDTPD